MPTDQEKLAFARRLCTALSRIREPVKGATQLALRFNLRYRAGPPISAQTAHKWLSGRSIPTPDKIETMAAWLGVGAHWLHYGPAPCARAARGPTEPLVANVEEQPVCDCVTLARKIEGLSPHHRYLVEELVVQLSRSADR